MAITNGVTTAKVPGVQLELTREEAQTIVRAIDVVIAQVNRSKAKETDEVVLQRRDKQSNDLRNLANKILYGGKDLV